MKKRENKNIWTGFLINMLGVILAIILTFGVNSIWQKQEEKKKTKEMLILVRNELKDNKEWFKSQEKMMRVDGYVYQKILEAKDDLTSIPADTLDKYIEDISQIAVSNLKTTAWQIFQNSEMIQKISNKELLIRLTDCYIGINTLHEFIMQNYWETKKKTFLLMMEADDSHDFFNAILKNNEFAFFYTMFSLKQVSVWELFPSIDAAIDYTVMLLDKYGDFKYDMADLDDIFEKFIKNRVDSVNNLNNSILEQNNIE